MTQPAPTDLPPLENVTPSYRRNGKLQSCEPCRKGKLKCDHQLPTCGRCARRGKIEACIYHPAPLTKPRASPALSARGVSSPSRSQPPSFSTGAPYQQSRTTSLVSPPTTTSVPVSASSNGATAFRSGVAPLSAVLTESPQLSHSSLTRRTSSSDHYPVELMPVKDNKTGFLGSSAFSAVFTENKNSLGIEPPELEHPSDPDLPIPPEMIHRGAQILALFKDITLFEFFLTRWFEIGDGITLIRPIYGVWIKGIVEQFGTVLTQHERLDELYELSALVWRNTRNPIAVDGTTSALDWAALQTGQNLRWETLGALCSAIGLIAMDLSEYDSAFRSARARGIAKDRRTMTEMMKNAIEETLAFCKYCESITDVYLCVLYESVLLLETLRGDAYSGSWYKMGETVDTAILLGYHQTKVHDDVTPFYVAELRTRLFDQIFGHDKSISTFLGRPPRLGHRYCVIQLPLDLSDEELCLQGDELQTAISRLNDGWNSSNRFTRATWRRVRAQHIRVREDILEIVLGTLTDDMALKKAEEIRSRIRQINASMPDFVNADVLEVLDSMHSDTHPLLRNWERERIPVNIMHLVYIHAAVVHEGFLLERSLVNRLRSQDTSALIAKARSLLGLVLAVVSKRDQLRDFSVDIIALLAAFGLPAAGVIGVEMLRQEQSGTYTPDLPRSKVIQDLSVFVSALATVSPGEGNYAICHQGQTVLSKILDKILSQPLQPARAAQTHEINNDTSLYLPTGNDAEFMQWLDNLEWERGSLFNQ